MQRNLELPQTALVYVIGALIPFTDPNLKLVFRPHLFFKDLAMISSKKEQTLRNAYNQACKIGLIKINQEKQIQLTDRALAKVQPFVAKELGKSAVLMITFDIPERLAHKRQMLRRLLRELKFKQIQKSVWCSNYDYRDYIKFELKDAKLEPFVHLYKALRIN